MVTHAYVCTYIYLRPKSSSWSTMGLPGQPTESVSVCEEIRELRGEMRDKRVEVRENPLLAIA